MKKVIAGSKYDTDTAQLLGTWTNGYIDDFEAIEESLYRTKAGKYFLHGVGGPKSRYGKWVDNSTLEGGSEIIPLTREAAQKWAEEHLDTDTYEEAFGPVPEGPEKESLNLLIPAGMKARLRTLAEEQEVSLTALVEQILAEALQKEEES